MSSEYTLKITTEQAREMPMVDLAFELLKSANTPFYYRDLMAEIAKIKGLSEQHVMQVIAQLYTEINIDGRFACVGTNLWGLKRWYPVEKSDDAVGNAKRPRIINDEDDDLDEDIYAEEEDTYAEEDEYDTFGTETEEEEAEEDTEFFEDEEIEEDLGEAGIEESDEDSDDDLDEDSDEDDEEDDLDEEAEDDK
ncbi:DNA-directed RNA polymerase subunit delta [Paenibacillus alginolyticus]|jgi:DNA-directed RNA polymerase subunit delta|uniref:Probable DNA-directed RNA polymerase subunit delta n=1 Tax=Paenibacillus alginolyticus TaxID=59839 RepID=A0ABT4GLP5_9BACL|nr:MULTISPECIES: DNA-directed RNA polymerase subunit delta [Paenibacillus]MCY9668144.1 DNA-directed RNA polymerase subunit delta [Paenibacillus alginolyticus]MCY9697123.1 DNA-directed RNA polymerase subunit delta [Paenibacillus alginolyticus]MEC0144703.1 DNA-directed RNA polymerase subunit delta [Paenibacillus alginolyticus]NRF89899.1 DNA-directed RNA polymerase subunit delta [Paenibacillus frigoriresistens]